MYTFLLLFLAKARHASPPQASLGRITESTSFANMHPFSKDLESIAKYWGALLRPASTHGRKVYPIYLTRASYPQELLSIKCAE